MKASYKTMTVPFSSKSQLFAKALASLLSKMIRIFLSLAMVNRTISLLWVNVRFCAAFWNLRYFSSKSNTYIIIAPHLL
jgi:hypothetical protein